MCFGIVAMGLDEQPNYLIVIILKHRKILAFNLYTLIPQQRKKKKGFERHKLHLCTTQTFKL